MYVKLYIFTCKCLKSVQLEEGLILRWSWTKFHIIYKIKLPVMIFLIDDDVSEKFLLESLINGYIISESFKYEKLSLLWLRVNGQRFWNSD